MTLSPANRRRLLSRLQHYAEHDPAPADRRAWGRLHALLSARAIDAELASRLAARIIASGERRKLALRMLDGWSGITPL